MSDTDSRESFEAILAHIEDLRNRVGELEKGFKIDGGFPKTALLSHSFLKRAFAVWGHYFVAGLIIAIPIWLMILLVIAAFSGFR